MKVPGFLAAAAALTVMLCLPPAFPQGSGEKAGGAGAAAAAITVTGRVRLVGNAPFMELTVSTDETDWYVEGADREKLSLMEQRVVTVRGTPSQRDLVLANGVKAGVKRFLRDITVMSE